MFIASTETMGGKGIFEIYKKLKQRKHKVTIILTPNVRKHEIINDIDLDFAKKFDKQDIIFPCNDKPPYKKCMIKKKEKADFIFIQNPYDLFKDSILDPNMTHEGLKKISKKIAYIVYGPHIFSADGCIDKNLKNRVDIIFADSESTKKIFINKGNFDQEAVIVSGYPNYKTLREKIKMFPKNQKKDYKETILWLPRWTVGFKWRKEHEGGSTFFCYINFFINYAKKNPNINIIIRPHNNLFKYALERHFLLQEDVDELMHKLKAVKNIVYSNHIFQPLEDDIIQSDIIISDGTSALGEVVAAGKPIIYLSNGLDKEFESDDLSKEFKNFVYFARDPIEIEDGIACIRKCDYAGYENSYSENYYEKERSLFYRVKRKMGLENVGLDNEYKDFQKKVDPVEDPAQKIVEYIETYE